MATRDFQKTPSEYEERVLEIKRVSKKTKGGNKIGFTALVVIGDRKGKVGSGLGKASDVPSAIRKGVTVAKRNLVSVSLKGTSIPHDVTKKHSGAKMMLKPAPVGSGIIAGGVIRHVVELAGVSDISAKSFGSSNKLSNVRCTIEALQDLKFYTRVGKDSTEKVAESSEKVTDGSK